MSTTMDTSPTSSSKLSSIRGITQSGTSSTLDDASLNELDRIMDTLSTLSRETSLVRTNMTPFSIRPPNRGTPSYHESKISIPPVSSQPMSSNHSYLTSPITRTSLPPPMTSPPSTPALHPPRHFLVAQPKIMTLSTTSPHEPFNRRYSIEECMNPATIPRIANPYENTSILHGSHFSRPPNVPSIGYSTAFVNPITTSDSNSTVVNEVDSSSNRYFFGPLPISPQRSAIMNANEQNLTNTLPASVPNSGNEAMNNFPVDDYRPNTNNEETSLIDKLHSTSNRAASNQEASALPAYNTNRSYLKNLEEGTLPRPRIDSARPDSTQNSNNASRTNRGQQQDDAVDGFGRLSFRRSHGKQKRTVDMLNLRNLSKTSSRHSSNSYNSYNMGRGFNSVSTAPASTRGLIQHEVYPDRRRGTHLSQSTSPQTSSTPSKGDKNCWYRNGKFLYCYTLEIFILVAFFAGLPLGIVLQATGFHSTEHFEKYYTFWGSGMLPKVLSTITPLLIISSMLSGMANLSIAAIKKLTLIVILFYFMSVTVATAIAVAMCVIMKPGSSLFVEKQASSITENSTSSFANVDWPDIALLDRYGFLRDDGLTVFSFRNGNQYYDTANVKNVSASDEVLSLIRSFFPGFEDPTLFDMRMCNLYVLILLASVIGLGASRLRIEGELIRRVVEQAASAISNMVNVILWYLPVGILFLTSELIATRIDWAKIGHDRPPPSTKNATFDLSDVLLFNHATKWYFITVCTSLGLYALFIIPLVVCVIVRTNPFSILGFRSIAPLLTAATTGFSDLCIPVTVRCLLEQGKIKGNTSSETCCGSYLRVDRRIARVSGVLGGMFHRGGSAIAIACSTVFLLQIKGSQCNMLTILLLSLSATVTSVTSIGGRWFSGSDPYMRAIVIGLTSCGSEAPALILRSLFYLWLISRFAAFTDVIIDIFSSHLFHFACKNQTHSEISHYCHNCHRCEAAENKERNGVCEGNSRKRKIRSFRGEASDYEEAPLIFNRACDTGNETESTHSKVAGASNDDSVFLSNHDVAINSNNSSNHCSVIHRMSKHVSTGDCNDATPRGQVAPETSNTEEVCFVTF